MVSVWLMEKLTATLSPLFPLVRVKLPVKSILLPELLTPEEVLLRLISLTPACASRLQHAQLRKPGASCPVRSTYSV